MAHHYTEKADGIWVNVRIAPEGNPALTIQNGAMVVCDGLIEWVGELSQLPAQYNNPGWRRRDAGNRWMTPGLIDCHTHLVYGGNRAEEFALRLNGASYEEIARNGGGIVSTVRATSSADEDELFQQSAKRLEALIAEGVTTVEIKSGYGLDLSTERKILKVARRLGNVYPITVYTTFLGAHALPEKYAGRSDEYISLVCDEMLPTLHAEGLVDAVDVFCENIGFSVKQCEQVFDAAHKFGLPVKMHAEQLSNMGGTRLAAKYNALSVDHLEHLDEAGIQAIRNSGTVAVLLPGAYYFIRETQIPPLKLLRDYQIPIAISTDSNPGTSPTSSLLLMLNMACTLFHMTTGEVLMGVTSHAARALGKGAQHGLLAAGRAADFVLWDVDSLAELTYCIGRNPCALAVRAGLMSQPLGKKYE